ncbi:MAG: hypothetical protein JXR14_03715 [Paracoccaceae bacterium]
MPDRRTFLTLLIAGAFAPAASAHTLYNQWIVFRQKHLLIGSHRKDLVTYNLAREVVAVLDHLLPEAKARPARAPHPERLASLMGTGQLYLSVIGRAHAGQMRAGAERFAPYGEIPLTVIADLGDHLLVGHADFPKRHAWLVAAALRDGGYIAADAAPVDGMPRHPGAEAMLAGVPLEELPET